MFTLYRDLKNYLNRSVASRIKNCEIYKLGFSKFLIGTSRRNADLLKASSHFELAYSKISSAGSLVNDLQVVNQDGVFIRIRKADGTEYDTVNLATNSYNDLDLEEIPRRQLAEYVLNGELSSCLSRKVAGQLPIHKTLDNELRDFLGYESSLLATCGYIAQQATMFGLFRHGDVIFSDEHNHSSLVDGMRLTRAKIIVYPHLDYVRLEELIKHYRLRYNCAGIVSDGVFSAHGTMANLDRIHELKIKYNLVSVIDDTHGFAAIGTKMRGVLDFFQSKPDVLTASLAKGLAGFGGMIVGSSAIVRVIDCFGRQNINTSHLSPLVTAQSFFNLKFLRENLSDLQAEQISKVRYFNQKLQEFGIRQYENDEIFAHPIFSYFGETEGQMIDVVQKMFALGFTVAFFPQPVAPKPTIRFSLHRKVDFESLNKLAHFLKDHNLQALSQQYWPRMAYLNQSMKFSPSPDEVNGSKYLLSLASST